MAFPVITGVAFSEAPTGVSAKTVTLPGVFTAKDLLLVIFSTRTGASATTPAGWTLIITGSLVKVWARLADGSEGSSLAFTSGNGVSVHLAIRISGAHQTTLPQSGVGTNGTSTTPNPAALNPTWGAESTLWLAFMALTNTTETIVSYPAGYDDDQNSYAHTSGGGIVAFASEQSSLTSEDPGPYTITPSDNWTAHTFAIRAEEDLMGQGML